MGKRYNLRGTIWVQESLEGISYLINSNKVPLDNVFPSTAELAKQLHKYGDVATWRLKNFEGSEINFFYPPENVDCHIEKPHARLKRGLNQKELSDFVEAFNKLS